MPTITVMVPETLNSVTRPVVLEIARQLKKDLGMAESIPVFFPGDTEQAVQPGSTITNTTDVNTFPFSDRLQITVNEKYDEDRILSMAVLRPENLYIFRDDRIEVSIKPAYSSTDFTINFTYRAVDKTQAERFRDDMRTRLGMGRDERIHKVKYHYLIPPELLVILKDIHRMREAVEGYGETYDEYFKANTTQKASLLTNLAGEQGAWGISEAQQRVVGYWDFEGPMEPGSKEDDLDTLTVTFGYKFKLDKPVACVMHYPLMIHNQLMDVKYRLTEADLVDTPEKHQLSYTLSAGAFAHFESGKRVGAMAGIDVPIIDDFVPSSVPLPTKRLATVLVGIDPNRPTLLMNLASELGDYTLHPAVEAFMRVEAPFMTKKNQSILQVNVYKNIHLQPWSFASVNADLDVLATNPLALRDYWHVRLSVVTNLRQLSARALESLRNHGTAAQLLIEYIAPWLGTGVPPILAGDYISKIELDKIIDEINHHTDGGGNHQSGYQFNTVGTVFLQSFKME